MLTTSASKIAFSRIGNKLVSKPLALKTSESKAASKLSVLLNKFTISNSYIYVGAVDYKFLPSSDSAPLKVSLVWVLFTVVLSVSDVVFCSAEFCEFSESTVEF